MKREDRKFITTGFSLTCLFLIQLAFSTIGAAGLLPCDCEDHSQNQTVHHDHDASLDVQQNSTSDSNQSSDQGHCNCFCHIGLTACLIVQAESISYAYANGALLVLAEPVAENLARPIEVPPQIV